VTPRSGSPRIRAVFLDLDGTLLDSSLGLPERSRAALSRATAAGVVVVLTSGRPARSLLRFARAVRGLRYLIASNGGCLVDVVGGGATTFSTLPGRTVDAVLRIAEAHGVSPCVYGPLEWYAAEVDENVAVEVRRSWTEPVVGRDLRRLETEVVKLLLIGPPERLRDCHPDLRRLGPDAVEWFSTYEEYLEIMPAGMSKAVACQEVLRLLGVGAAEAMAVGDGRNDVPMLQWAGLAVAVANAGQEALAVADYTTSSNDHDGVAWAIDGLVFGDAAARAVVRPVGGDRGR